MYKTYNDYRRIMIAIVVIGCIFIVLGMFLHSHPLAWTKGVVFGTIFSVLRLALMKNTFERAVEMAEVKAKRYTALHYSLRYIITAVILTVSALEPSIDLWGTFAGLLTIKLGMYSLLIFNQTGK